MLQRNPMIPFGILTSDIVFSNIFTNFGVYTLILKKLQSNLVILFTSKILFWNFFLS